MARYLSEAEKATVYNALRHAAGLYREDAAKMRKANNPGLAAQFDRQVHEADSLADEIEFDTGTVELGE